MKGAHLIILYTSPQSAHLDPVSRVYEERPLGIRCKWNQVNWMEGHKVRNLGVQTPIRVV